MAIEFFSIYVRATQRNIISLNSLPRMALHAIKLDHVSNLRFSIEYPYFGVLGPAADQERRRRRRPVNLELVLQPILYHVRNRESLLP